MKRRRAPSNETLSLDFDTRFFRRSSSSGAIAGYQLHQLQSDIDGLNHQLTVLNQLLQQKSK